MKFEQLDTYKPIVITLTTQEELEILIYLIKCANVVDASNATFRKNILHGLEHYAKQKS